MRPLGIPEKAHMLYYDDARHAYLYTVEPPPNVLDVLHPVDVVSNSMVDTFVFGLGIGRTMSYGTQVGEIWFGYAYAWIGYPLVEILPQPGPNIIEIAVRARPPHLGGPMTLAEAELMVDFVQQRNRNSFDRWS